MFWTVTFDGSLSFSVFLKVAVVNICFSFKICILFFYQVHCVMYLIVYFMCLHFSHCGSQEC